MFIGRLRVGYQKKFYHGKPPQDEVNAFQADMVEEAVNEVLLVNEARKRGLSVASDYIDAEYKKRTEGLTQEEVEAVDDFSVRLRSRIEIDRLIDLIEENVIDSVVDPSESQVRIYYEKNPEKFTTPSRERVQMILLGVPAFGGQDMWAEATEKAAVLVADLRSGADFFEQAMIHSSDVSASNGGDMGFLHDGMLGGTAQQVVGLMEPGDISEPVLLLEGVGIFKLLERTEATLNEFSIVQSRAKSLLVRELKDSAWVGLKEKLNANADVIINPVFLVTVK